MNIICDECCKHTKQDALIYASSENHIKCLELLCTQDDTNCDLNYKNQNNEFALMNASFRGHDKCVQILCSSNNINVDQTDYYEKSTSLIKASSKGYVKCVQLLIDFNANINHQNRWNETALMKASAKGHLECLKVLCAQNDLYNIDIGLCDENGNTALTHAIKRKHEECVEFLKNVEQYGIKLGPKFAGKN